VINLFLIVPLMALTKPFLNLFVSFDILADNLGVDFKCKPCFFCTIVQEAIDKYEDKPLHALLLYLPLQTLLHKLILCSLFDIHQ
jgi:hypothetical protein